MESKLVEDARHEIKAVMCVHNETSATNLLFGLREAISMLVNEEGLENVFRRHYRHAGLERRSTI